MANDTTAKQLNAVAQAYRDMMNKQPDAVVVETTVSTPAPAPVSSVKSTLSKITAVAQAYRDMQVKPVIAEAKEEDDEDVIPEEITKEDASDFIVAASAAKKAGKKKFTFGGKEYPVTIKTDIKTETVKKGNVTINPEEKDTDI